MDNLFLFIIIITYYLFFISLNLGYYFLYLNKKYSHWVLSIFVRAYVSVCVCMCVFYSIFV